jgi:hypothetical protein
MQRSSKVTLSESFMKRCMQLFLASVLAWTSRRLVVAVGCLGLAVAGMAAVTPAAHALGLGMACVFNQPDGAVVFGGARGHIGWGYEVGDSGQFVFGATEDPNGTPLIRAGDGNPLGAWHASGNFTQMLQAFQFQPHWGSWPNAAEDASSHATSQYTRYKCVDVANSAVTAANNEVNVVEGNGLNGVLYSGAGWNCMNHAYAILTAYNAQGLPDPSDPSNYIPNNWFGAISASPISIGGQGYQVTGADSAGLALQTAPHIGHVDSYVPNGTNLIVVCQTKFGDQVDGRTQYGRPFTTWDMLWDGHFVYDWYMNTPTVATNGYSPGIPACVSG